MANDATKFALIFLLGLLLLIAICKNVLFESNSMSEVPTAISSIAFSPGVATQRHDRRPYECKKSGCTVKLLDHRREKIVSNESNQNCTFKILDDYFAQTHQFHGEGTWYAPTPEDPDLKIEYRPTICSFDSVSNTKDGLRKCLRENQVRKIVVTGDSNGRHFKDGILEVMEQSGTFTCHTQRSMMYKVNGTYQKDDTYFDVPDLYENKLTLSGSMSNREDWSPKLYKCKGNNIHVKVEYIHSGKVLDTTTYLSPRKSGTDFESRLHRADSLLEYLLKYYYPYRGFPDVWFYTPPFHIAINSFPLQSLELHIDMMLKLFSSYLPVTTQLIFLSDATQCPDASIQEMAARFTAYWNITMDERIHDMNQVLFAKLVDEAARKINYHVFLDATRVACPVTCTWHHDAAHMLPIWYNKMAEYNMNLLCASE